MNYETQPIRDEDRTALPGPDAAPSRRRWWIIGAVVVLVVIAVLWFATGGDESAQPAGGGVGQAPTVTVAVVGRGAVQREVSGNGTIAARREMPVGVAGEGGEVTRVLVEAGDWVKAGQVLATVDRSVQNQTADQLVAQVRAARADADLAQQELDRAKKLVDRGFISQADIDQKTATRDSAAAQVRVARAQLAEAKARTAKLDIRAPAAGLVLTRDVEPGQIVGPGSGTLFRVAKGGQMEMRAKLSEGDLAQLSVGNVATVKPVGQSKAFRGQVWQVSPVIDPQTRQGIARIALDYDPALRPGGFAAATIGSTTAQAAILPDSAIQSDKKGNFVYIVDDDNRAVRRDVTVGEVTDRGVSVTGGLSGDEKVVLTAGAFLNPGQKVKPEMQTKQPAEPQ